MECRSPSPVYAIFLQEQLFNFKLIGIVEGLNLSISTPHKFYYAFQSSLMTLKNLLCELYLHNLAVPDNTKVNSLLYVGDVQLRVVISWIKNEISHEHQSVPYKKKEMSIPLMMRSEVHHSKRIYFDQISITRNPSGANKSYLVR